MDAKDKHFQCNFLRLNFLLLPFFSGVQQHIGHLGAEMWTVQTDKPTELSCPVHPHDISATLNRTIMWSQEFSLIEMHGN
jgi:hypothetical protein